MYHPATVAPHRDAVERVIEEMYAHFAEPLSLRRLAEVACFSPYHFHRLFSATTGLPPARFLAAIRLQEAKKLLLREQRSITEICMSVGYSSLGTFSSRFHASVGVSPSELRRLAQDPTVVAAVALRPMGDLPQAEGGPVAIHGEIDAEAATGPIFVGVFPRCSPERLPLGCRILSAPGRFSMRVPRGAYYILAASLGLAADPIELLLPDRASVRVAGHRAPVRRLDGPAFVRLRLRAPTLLDPPLLVALPALLAGAGHQPVTVGAAGSWTPRAPEPLAEQVGRSR